ncbi:MAG: MaoC family dehydratase [Burkholderiales bacterium]|nr:MaoC family dehydratase [Burkholderiales bacterium]
MTDPRDRSFADIEEGERLGPLHISVTQQHINDYQEFLGHFDGADPDKRWLLGNNLHVDEEYSKRNMFGGLVGDGHQTIQYVTRLLTDHLPWGTLISGYSTVDVKLTNPTRPNDEVEASGHVVGKFTENGRNYVLCEVQASKQGGVTVAMGTIKAYVPR